MKTSYTDRDTTTALKGIALIFMFIHHFFTFPGFYVEGVSYPYLAEFAKDYCVPFKICVPVFAFLTGYFYAFRENRTFRYSLRKITDFYISYWFVCIPLMIFTSLTGCWEYSRMGILKELLALETPAMFFCWYVHFYAVFMLLLPLLTQSQDHTPAEDVIVLLILPVAATNVLRYCGWEGFVWDLVIEIRDWFPCVAVGYLFAKYDLFEKHFTPILTRCRREASRIALCLVMALAAFFGRYYGQFLNLGALDIRGGVYGLSFTMDIFYAPLFVFGVCNLLQYLRKTFLFSLLGKIGSQSMLMWFLHCIFFNVTKEITQPFIYAPRNPILVLIFALAVCYAAAVIIDKLLKPTLKLKNKLM